MNDLDALLAGRLRLREESGLLRTLKPASDLADFTSNDYLGLARSSELFDRIAAKLDRWPSRKNGATGSRLLSGNDRFTQDVERRLAEIFQAHRALIFNSGYAANLSVLSSLPQRGDTVLYDALAHACIKDGARLSPARRFSFQHNDLGDLEAKLRKAEGRIFIAVESVYSMDGDVCPLLDLVPLADAYGAHIILDEAHSTGVMGNNGAGLAVSLGLHERIAIRIYTFGKAMGIHGACVAGSETLTAYLVNFARPFIYTTALPPHSVVAIDESFAFLKDNAHLQTELASRIDLFLKGVQGLTNRTASTSAIQTALFVGNGNARQAALFLQQHTFDVRPILSPTVPAGTERLRMCLHVYNTPGEIAGLVDCLKQLNGVLTA